MKDLFQISVSVKVEASPLAKGLSEPIVNVINKSIPYFERYVEARVSQIEKEVKQTPKEQA